MELRRIEKLVGREWHVVQMKELNPGDLVRMCHDDNDPSTLFYFQVTSKPTLDDKVWGCEGEIVKKERKCMGCGELGCVCWA